VVLLVASQDQLQFQQGPKRQHQQQPRHKASRMQFDPIPMAYAKLLPILIKENLVHTRAPPRVPNELPVWYQSDLSCAFHQGEPDHDIKHCFSLKIEVQKLIEANILSFKDWIRTCKLTHYRMKLLTAIESLLASLLLIFCWNNVCLLSYVFQKNPFVPPKMKVNLRRAFASCIFHQNNLFKSWYRVVSRTLLVISTTWI